jgi:serine/threonine protein kinase
MAQRFGKHELVRRIGAGGMAEVHLARTYGAEGFVKNLVIKRLLPEFSEDPEIVRMFIQEARLAAHLRHANIVQIFEFDHVEGSYYIAMEWVDGVDLRRLQSTASRRSMSLSTGMAVHIGVETLKGLHFAHRVSVGGSNLGLIHRDISPHNLLVSFAGEVKIGDFGIAKIAQLATQTRVGVIKGKLAYMPPEQVRGEILDQRSDLFALGVVLWELLAGRRAYQSNGHELALVEQVRDGRILPLAEVAPRIDPGLASAVDRLLAADRTNRFATAAEALTALGRHAVVGEDLRLAEFICGLFPGEAERERQPATAVLSGAQVSVTEAAPDAPTRLKPTIGSGLAGSNELSGMALAGSSGGSAAEDPVSLVDTERGTDRRSLPASAQGGDPQAGSSSEVYPKVRLRRSISWPFAALLLLCFGAAGFLGWSLAAPSDVHTPDPTSRITVVTDAPGLPVAVDGASRMPVEQTIIDERKGARSKVSRAVGGLPFGRDVHAQEGLQQAPLRAPAKASAQAPDASTTSDRVPGTTDLGVVPATRTTARSSSLGGREAAAPAAGTAPRRVRPTRQFSRLNVIVDPWAEVLLDGKSLGSTPIRDKRVTAGRHRLRLTNQGLAKDVSRWIYLSPGETRSVRYTW